MRRGETDRLERVEGSLHPAVLSSNVFQICSVLEIPQLHMAGRCGPRRRMLLARVGDHLETFFSAYHRLPSGPSCRAKEREGYRPLEPKTGTHNVRWVSPARRRATELSFNGTTLRHATTPDFKNHHRWIAKGLDQGPLKRSTQASISLLTRTLPLAPEVGTAKRCQPTC